MERRALQVFAPEVPVEVVLFIGPFLVDLDGEGLHEAQAAGFVGEDPDQEGPALDLLVDPLQQIGRLEVLMVRSRQAVKGEGFIDVRLDPGTELGVLVLPAGEPTGQIPPGLRDVVAVMTARSRSRSSTVTPSATAPILPTRSPTSSKPTSATGASKHSATRAPSKLAATINRQPS